MGEDGIGTKEGTDLKKLKQARGMLLKVDNFEQTFFECLNPLCSSLKIYSSIYEFSDLALVNIAKLVVCIPHPLFPTPLLLPFSLKRKKGIHFP